jgi:diguanylate cyclase (GGDEF)-like protein
VTDEPPPGPGPDHRFALAVIATALAVGGSALAMELTSKSASNTIANVLEIIAPTIAAVLTVRAARRAEGRGWRVGWLLIAASCVSWAIGQVIWTWFETIRNEPTPFPSAADGFFLLAIPLAVGGLLAMPSSSNDRRDGTRVALDGLIVATSVLLVSWVLVVGPLLHRSSGTWVERAISLAYPAGDVMILTMAIVACTRSDRAGRAAIGLTGLGFVSFALADSLFVYTTQQTHSVSNLSNTAWIAGYLLIALGALHATHAPPARVSSLTSRDHPGTAMTVLPYVPVSIVLALAIGEAIVNDPIVVGDAEFLIGTLLIILMLVRQGVVIRENSRLTRSLASSNERLQYQLLHDNLTGLPNRPLFGDRLRVALTRMDRLDTLIAVMFIDLDLFKQANDTYGHDAGDEVLITVARRLVTTLRAGDTVARFGGDEFMVLCEGVADVDEAAVLAERLAEAITEPVPVGDVELQVQGSIGLVVSDDTRARPGDLIREADRAMYRAKREGRARIELVDATASASPRRPDDPDLLIFDPAPSSPASA